MFVCLLTVMFEAQGTGHFFSFAPDISKATSATVNVTRLLEHKPDIDVWSKDGKVVGQLECDHIEFRNICFSYPTRYVDRLSCWDRREIPVLRGLNLEVQAGKYVALVGASGCDKSTTVGLIERFYDPTAGQVLVVAQVSEPQHNFPSPLPIVII